jgi:hypothetical protein
MGKEGDDGVGKGGTGRARGLDKGGAQVQIYKSIAPVVH